MSHAAAPSTLLQQLPHLAHSDASGSAAIVAFDGNDLEVVFTQFHLKVGPCLEVVCDGNGPAYALRGADRPVLMKGRVFSNRDVEDAGILYYVVC